MTSRIITVAPFDLVVFGGTGDLAFRKIIPALYQRHRDGQIPPVARIVGVSRRPLSDDEYRTKAENALTEHVPPGDRDRALIETFLKRLHFVSVDAQADEGWDVLGQLLATAQDRIRAFYLAVAPELFGPISDRLGAHGLVTDATRVVIEKPVGHDLKSAIAVNEAIGRVFNENQVYRIDHYLGKETVQNLMALRFANALFEPLWSAAHVDNVQITVAETIGVAGRGDYYDNAGALRDMVQNHMMQLLCLVAMETPSHMDADAVRDEKIKVLRSLAPIDAAAATALIIRGQYRAGRGLDGPMPGYAEDVNNGASTTETFVALKVDIRNWRWAGVPFYLRTGKRLATHASEIVVTFRDVPHSIFDEAAGAIEANRLVLRLQPDEGVRLWLMIKDPGPGGMRLRYVPLDMSFAQAFGVRSPDAYERLILDTVRGNQTLFMRRDEVEAAWAWVDPIVAACNELNDAPKPYPAGSWGPAAATALIARDGRIWHDPMS